MIETYHTIRKSETIYSSGNFPILVECNDLNTWICKHGRTSPRLLFNELIGSSFAKIWGIPTPDFSLIEVLEEHLPDDTNTVQPLFFKKHCFGSKFINDCQVIDDTLIPSLKNVNFRKRIVNKNQFLLICLFDIWLGNEDRAPHHSNLILDYTAGRDLFFTVFDHDALFNQLSIGQHEMTLLDEECSLITGEMAKILFKHNINFVYNVNKTVETSIFVLKNVPTIYKCTNLNS